MEIAPKPETAPIAPVETTSDERTMAVLANALQMVGAWIGPLIILLVKRESRFVSFHALQALLLQVVHVIVMVVFMVLWFAMIFSGIILAQEHHSSPPLIIFAVFPLFWLVWMCIWVFTLVIVILYSIKAGRGEWAEYPIFGKIARRILKLGPGGVPLEA